MAKQQPNQFAKPPFQGFTRRVKRYDRLPKKYNYIQKSHWHMVMQFLRKN